MTGGTPAPRERVKIPAVLVIVVGVLNLLGAAGLFLISLIYGSITPEQLRQILAQQPEQRKQFESLGVTPEEFLDMVSKGFGIGGCVVLLAAVLILAGGICMLALRSYPLAVIGAVLAALPFISCSGCCGLGEAAGIWALVVLVQADVRAAFRRPVSLP
jgi:hypothetical protein